MGRRIKVKLQDSTPARVIFIDPSATEGATLGTNVFLPSGVVGTPATVRAWLEIGTTTVPPNPSTALHHGLLQGLTIGDDHPMYTRKDTLTTLGDLYVRGVTTVERLGIGDEGEVLKVVGGIPAWATDELAVESIQPGLGIEVDNYDPANPVVSILDTLTFLTENDETAELPASRMLVAGTNVTFNTSTPGQLRINATGGAGGGVDSVVGTPTEIDVDDYDPANPVLSLAIEVLTSLALADTAAQPGDNVSIFTNDAGYITAASLPVGANPSASVGLTAVNGSALTFMRSDAAPALSQSIAPTWSGIHTFTQAISGTSAPIILSSSLPGIIYEDTDEAANARKWREGPAGASFNIRITADDGTVSRNAFSATRSGAAIASLELGNSTNTPTINFAIKDFQINGDSGTAAYYLRSGGAGVAPTWAVLPTTATGANPTASVGLTAVNGSASTFMRSDGAPPIDQAIVPTWTGIHTFQNRIDQTGTSCVMRFSETDAPTDEKIWRLLVNNSGMLYSTRTDADAAGRTAMLLSRTGIEITTIELGNTTSLNTVLIPGANTPTLPNLAFINDTDTGIFRAATNVLALAAGGSEALRVNANGAIGVNSASFGTAGQVLMTFGSGATADWQDTSVVFRYPGLGYYYVYDFVYDPTTSAGDGWDVINAGTGASVTSTAGIPGHPGIIKLISGSTSTAAYAGVSHSSQGGAAPVGGFSIGGGVLTVVIVFRFTTLIPVSATSEAQASIGLVDEVTDEPTNGVFFQSFFDSGTFKVRGCARAASADTVTGSAYLTPTLDQWYVGKIVVNAAGTSVQFFIDGASIGTVASGLPATTAPLTEGFVYAKNTSSATLPALEIDVVETWYKLTTARY